MLANITRLDLRLRRRSAVGYAAGIAVYTLHVVALYPSFKSSTSLTTSADPPPQHAVVVLPPPREDSPDRR